MKRWGVLGVLLLLPAVVSARQVVRQRWVNLQLDVDAQGQVSAARVMPPPHRVYMSSRHGVVSVPAHAAPLPKVLASAAEQIAMHWRFKAPLVEGKPVSGRTWASAKLQVVKQAGGAYGVRLLYRRNGPYVFHKVPPWYPVRMRRLGRYAVAFVRAEVRPDNSMTDVQVVKVYTNGDDDGRVFAGAAKQAVEHWKARAEHVNGRAVPTRLEIPIEFRLGGQFASRAGEDQLMKRARLDMQIKYGYPAQKNEFAPGQAQAVDSPFVKQPSS